MNLYQRNPKNLVEEMISRFTEDETKIKVYYNTSNLLIEKIFELDPNYIFVIDNISYSKYKN